MRIKRVLGLMALASVFLFTSLVFAAGSVTQLTRENYPDSDLKIKKLIFLCTGDAANGSIPNTDTSASNTSFIEGWRLFQVEAYPTAGGTAPDAADVFILDADGMDLLGAIDGSTTAYNGANLIHATLKYATHPDLYTLGQTAHSSYYPVVTGALTLKVSNQATASANWTIVLTFIK
jgi:hypothetical protein